MKILITFLLIFIHFVANGQSFNEYANAGIQAEQQRNYREALDQYLRAYQLQPSNPEINRKVGFMYFYLNRFDSAIFFYTEALKLNPKDTAAYIQRGTCYLDINENQKALDDYAKCSKLSKKVNPNIDYFVGKCYEGLGDWDFAIGHFTDGLTLHPGDKDLLYEIAYCYTLKFDKVNAMKFYNKAIAQDPDFYDAYLNRGLLFQSQFKNYPKALDDFERSIEIKPNNKLSYLYEGELYNDEQQFNNAKDVFDKVITLFPDFGEAYFERAMSWTGLRSQNDACNDLTQAEKLGYKKATEYKKAICK